MTQNVDLIEESALRELDIPEPWHLGRADRVRFHEVDSLGHVNNATYLTWFETFRLSYVVHHKLAYYAPDAPVTVLLSAEVAYKRPIHLSEDYVTTGRVTSFRNSSFVMEYGVYTHAGLAATGRVVHVLFAADGVTKVKNPERVIDVWLRDDKAVDER